MSQSLIQQSGAQPQKQPRYVPIHIARAQAGLVTNRAALHDISIGLYGRFYGGQPDALFGGSNVEISPQQTWKHRPGCSAFATLPSKCLTSFPYFNTDGSITLYMDTATGVYTNPASPTLVFTKSSGAGQTSFLQIGNTLYMSNGVDNKKVIGGKVFNWAGAGPVAAPTVAINSIGSGAAASIPWSASTVFSTMGLLKDSNSNIQQLVSVNADGTNTVGAVIGTSGVGEPVWVNTSGSTVTEVSGLQWECYGPVGLWTSNSTYTNISAGSSASLSQPAFIFDPNSGYLFGFVTDGAGTGTSGNSRPNFGGVPIGGHVGDHGFKWYNFGKPATWQPSTHYNQFSVTQIGGYVVEETTPVAAGYGSASQQTVYMQVCISSGGGTSDGSHTGPQWSTSQNNPVTRDGQLNYQYLGSATWASGHTYTQWQAGTPFFNVIYDGTNLQVCLTGGLSGGSAPGTWQTAYGAITHDNTVSWVCVGPPLAWAASTKWFLPASGFAPPVASVNPYGGSSILDSNGNVESVTSSGKSSTTAPAWPTAVNGTVTDGGITWTLTALASSFKGSTALAFTQGYAYAYAWKSRSSTDFYVTNIPNGQAGALGPPIGCGSGGITTASAVYEMPVGSNTGAIMQVSGAWPFDLQYDTVCIFRCTDGFQGGPYLELTEIACPTPVNGVYQGTWTFFDSIPDIQLNELIEADVIGLNSPPPTGMNYLSLHMNRIWSAVGNTVYASSGPDIPPDNGNGYEGWAPANTFPLQSPVNRTLASQAGLLCLTTAQPYIIAGGPSISQFFPWQIATGFSLANYNALQVIGGEIYMFTADGRFVAWQPGVGHTEPGFPIADQLAPFTGANVYVTEHANGQDPSSFYVCNGSTGWFRLVPHASPGFISSDQPVWSPFATITGGCTGVQSVYTAPGVRSLLVYQSSGTILKRDLTTAQDAGTNFSGNYTIGSIVLAHPGQLAELGFVTMEFANLGSPTVGYLLNEISGSFHTFTSFLSDPPLVYGTTTAPSSYAPNRYYFEQTVDTNQIPPPLLVRHLQLEVTYPAENFFHELYSFCIDGALHAEL